MPKEALASQTFASKVNKAGTSSMRLLIVLYIRSTPSHRLSSSFGSSTGLRFRLPEFTPVNHGTPFPTIPLRPTLPNPVLLSYSLVQSSIYISFRLTSLYNKSSGALGPVVRQPQYAGRLPPQTDSQVGVGPTLKREGNHCERPAFGSWGAHSFCL